MKCCKFCSCELIKDVNWKPVQYKTHSKVCHSCKLEYQRVWRKENPDSYKKWKYNITQEEFDSLLLAQNNKCAICRTDTPKGRHNTWQIDHCHKTGKVRGLLCWACNAGLGQFKDDTTSLFRAYKYIKESYED